MDESLSIRVPADWQRMDESLLPAAVVLAAQGSDERDLVIVRRFDDQRGAEDQAVWVAAGLSDRGVICERLDSSDVLGASNLVFDCPSPEGETARRLLVPVPTADGSVLFLVETSAGDSLEHAAAVAGPIVASLKTF
ncbi:hypothetical protein Cch01nite_00040 [Cellulomonas chitinilytica]|uniref:Uncharacterized protein n=2 Tax=Cellulomonas chitinilytica TaxID=398759 RepID=A0A919TXD0_9CELL|nr:hypothetical protein Cch01nite_00040 [Cellulomonas chitinilytica]